MIIALAEGSWVSIGLAVFMLFLTAFSRYKAKADKADIMTDVDVEIDKKLKPIHKRINSTETDIKSIEKEQTAQGNVIVRIDTTLTFLATSMDEIKAHILSSKK